MQFNKLNFEAGIVELPEQLEELYDEAFDIETWWREHYKIPFTDDRYLSITKSEIYKDYLLMKMREYSSYFNTSGVPIPTSEEELLKMIEDDVEAIRNCKLNYATEEDYNERQKEEEEIIKALESDPGNKELNAQLKSINKRKELELQLNITEWTARN